MAGACGASNMESRIGEALSLVLQVDGDRVWALLILAMAEMERFVFQRVRRCARGGLLQTHVFKASFGEDPQRFLGFATWRAFSQVEMAVRNEK